MITISEIAKGLPVVYGECDVVVQGDMSVQDVFHEVVSQGVETVGVQTEWSEQPVLLSREQLLQALSNDIDGLQEMLNRIQKHVCDHANEQVDLIQEAVSPAPNANTVKFEQALKVMMEGLIILDTQARIEMVNPAARRLLDLDVNADLETVERSLDQLGFRALMTLPGRMSGQTSGQFRVKSSHSRLLDVRWSILNSDWGHMLGWVLTIRDITSEVTAEATKSEFIAAISHELRTPLTSIQNAVSNILAGVTGKVNDKTRQYLESMKKDCHRFADLINDLLDIAKLEAGNMPITQRVMNMGFLVQNTVEEFGPVAQAANLTLSCQIEPDICAVYADGKRIRQVLTGLLRNAVQYTPAGGVINVSVHDRGSDIVTEVADSGIGISTDKQKQLFTKFYQVAREAGPGSKGNGLGLALCKGIINIHSGTIWVESKPGDGSRFFFSLPKIEPDRILNKHIETIITSSQHRNARFGMLVLTFEMAQKSEMPLREAAGKIIGDLLAQSQFILASDLDIVMQTADNEMIFVVNDHARQTVESVQHKIEANLVNFLRKNFIGIPILPMLGVSIWPREGADKNGLETAARNGLAPLIAG